MKELAHIILEAANFHGGDVGILTRAIHRFAHLDYKDKGIQFHVFRPENVSLPDFSWHETTRKFFIPPEKWEQLIALSVEKGFAVWLDLFCSYGIEILAENLGQVRGVKLQPSVLDNRDILDGLARIDLHEKDLIIDVSGLELAEITYYLSLTSSLDFQRTLFQTRFQRFPTEYRHTSLAKLDVLRRTFPKYDLSYTDHLEGTDRFAISFPLLAYMKGCNSIEHTSVWTGKQPNMTARQLWSMNRWLTWSGGFTRSVTPCRQVL